MITEAEAEGFLNHFEQLLTQVKAVAISGSLPKGIASTYYSQMIGICNRHNKPVVLDCSGEAMLEVLRGSGKPTVIKPNTEELSQILNKEITDDVDSLKAALSQDIASPDSEAAAF